MTPQSELDLSGNFNTHPFAELLIEIGAAGFAGSLRIERSDQKMIVYFDQGAVIYAVSNARKFRLSEILACDAPAIKEFLAGAPKFGNDLEFANSIKESGILNEIQVKEAFTQQVEAILREALGWDEGEWTFSPLARLKSGIRTSPRVQVILLEHGRSLSDKAVSFRFRSMREIFEMNSTMPDVILEPLEAFVMSRLSATPTNVGDLVAVSGLANGERA